MKQNITINLLPKPYNNYLGFLLGFLRFCSPNHNEQFELLHYMPISRDGTPQDRLLEIVLQQV